MHRIFGTAVSTVYPLYVKKLERKGRSEAELQEVIAWLTGFDAAALQTQLERGATFAEFFAAAEIHPNASMVTGTICGVRIEELDDPLMRQIRVLDRLVDELARGRPMAKVLRA